MNILIIGSNGFIGKSLYNYLSSSYNVYGLDVVESNQKKFSQIISISEIENLEGINSFDFIINASGSTDVKRSNELPLNDFEKNTLNVYEILSIIKTKSPRSKFINISSGAVYGNKNSAAIETDKLNPVSTYGFNKKMAENICEHFYNQFKISSYSLRIFSAYGPGLKRQLFWDLYKKSLKTNQIELYGDSTDYRDFIYIDDICEFIKIIIEKNISGYHVFNLSSGMLTTIESAVKCFCNILDKNLKYSFSGNSLQGYPKGVFGDISKAKKIGFIPKYTLKQGLKKTIEWIKEQKQ